MGTLSKSVTTYNGGFTSLGRRTVDYVIRGAEPAVATRAGTLASGQVLKAMTFLESDSSGNLIAHKPLVEVATVEFQAIAAASTIILAGLVWTAGGSGTTAAQLATAWEDIAAGTAYTDLADRTGGGSFTSGTLTGYNTNAENSTTVLFTASTVAAATDIADTGTGANPTITIVQYAAVNPIVGLLVEDTNATSAATDVQIYISGNFWSNAINWGVDVSVDTITDYTGTAVACTAYETGCYTEKLRQKLIESTAGGTNFVIGQFTDGEVEV